jgi:hypothetical protein
MLTDMDKELKASFGKNCGQRGKLKRKKIIAKVLKSLVIMMYFVWQALHLQSLIIFPDLGSLIYFI